MGHTLGRIAQNKVENALFRLEPLMHVFVATSFTTASTGWFLLTISGHFLGGFFDRQARDFSHVGRLGALRGCPIFFETLASGLITEASRKIIPISRNAKRKKRVALCGRKVDDG
jgi:hypothetical protein